MRTRAIQVFVLTLAFCFGARWTHAADDPRAEALADACTSCHGLNGRSRGSIPSLTTLSRTQFIQALEEFREQKRAATVMNRIVRTYTPAEVELLADYFTSGSTR